jgi:hypothetical protein
MIDLYLRLAIDLKRNGFVEFEHGAAIEGSKRLPVEFEGNGHYRSRGLTMMLISRFSIAGYVNDLRIWKNAGIKRNCLFCLIIEPQTWGNLLNFHGISPTDFQSQMEWRHKHLTNRLHSRIGQTSRHHS